MKLTPDEQAILDGSQGETLAKVMHSVVLYGDAFGADHLVPVEGAPHMVTSFGANTIKPYFKMLDELIEAGLTTRQPFTVDPRPMEFETLDPGLIQRLAFSLIFGKQADYEKQLNSLGLKNNDAFTCACYLPEVGNTPAFGAILAWSESSAVVFANSVLGARTNRNSAGIDLMCDILGKTPYFGLLTDEGRKATWKIEVKTSRVPNAQLLGSAIGMKVMEDVPFIVGLDAFLGHELTPAAMAYLKDMGAASASNGAVGLYHVQGLTPEAQRSGSALLAEGYKTYVIDDAELERVHRSYPILWSKTDATPKRLFIGCPHLSHEQLDGWIERIETALKQSGQSRVKVLTYLSTAPDIAKLYRKNPETISQLKALGVSITTICPLMYMNNPLCAREPIATTSNKLRTYSTARFFTDEEAVTLMTNGKLPAGGE
jgi:predicted aconitase